MFPIFLFCEQREKKKIGNESRTKRWEESGWTLRLRILGTSGWEQILNSIVCMKVTETILSFFLITSDDKKGISVVQRLSREDTRILVTSPLPHEFHKDTKYSICKLGIPNCCVADFTHASSYSGWGIPSWCCIDLQFIYKQERRRLFTLIYLNLLFFHSDTMLYSTTI